MDTFDLKRDGGTGEQRLARAASVVQSAYQPHRSLPELLRAAMRTLALRTKVIEASLFLHGVGSLVVGRCGADVKVDWISEMPGASASSPVDSAVHAAEWHSRPAHHSVPGPQLGAQAVATRLLPVAYAGVELGELQISWVSADEAGLEDCPAVFEAFACRCGHLIKRYDVQRWAMERLGRPLLLVGACEDLHQAEVFVERAAGSGLPVLLHGEFGTEKAHLAVALHCSGPRRDGPFVEVNCADPAGQPAQWFEQARGGTLFFNGIDELPPTVQGQLPQYMHSRLGQWLSTTGSDDTRVVASTTTDLRQRVREGGFSRALLAEIDFLSVVLPPLRERRADIEALVIAALERHGHAAQTKISPDLLALCKAYAWPENLYELERSVARLAVMTERQPIRHVDVMRYAPWMAAQHPPALPVPVQDAQNEAELEAGDHELTGQAGPIHWARCAIDPDQAELGKLHDGLRKALLYLGERYAEPISLGQLAEQAHLSPSHLSYLFRSGLNTAFKPLLQRIRIEKAKEMLSADGRPRITEVALSVGFADLSHFEKSFRRIVGQSPREFRRGRAA